MVAPGIIAAVNDESEPDEGGSNKRQVAPQYLVGITGCMTCIAEVNAQLAPMPGARAGRPPRRLPAATKTGSTPADFTAFGGRGAVRRGNRRRTAPRGSGRVHEARSWSRGAGQSKREP